VEDYQANTVLSSPTGFISAITNVGAVRSRGAEADANLWLTQDLTLNGAAAINDTRYLSYSNAPSVQGSVAPTQNLTGQPVMGASRLTFNVAATYRTMLNDTQDVYAVLSYGYKSGFYGNIDDSGYSWVKPVGLTDARIGTSIDGEKLDLSLWVKNAFNQRYFNTVLGAATGSGGYFAGVGDPRTYGVTLATQF
jgi:iron complex outermembrane receptor protein